MSRFPFSLIPVHPSRKSGSSEVLIKHLTLVLSLITLIGAGFGCATVPHNSEAALTPAQKWAIATYRLLDEINHQHSFALGGDDLANQAHGREMLVRWWGIKDRKGALDILDWLWNEGHRAKFEKLRQITEPMSDSALDQELSKLYDTNAKEKILVVRAEGKRLGDRGILAWDLCRFIWVASRSYAAGYLTEEEAWARIMPAACKLQSNFMSWSDVADNYLIGRKFWGQGKDTDARMWEVKAELLQPENQNSPWQNLPWNTPLGCK